MWRVVIAMLLANACAEPVDYEVTTTIQSGTARLIVDGSAVTTHTETYEVADYDELRDVAASVTVRTDQGVEHYVVLPFAASACGSDEWMHTGELSRIEVRYRITSNGPSYVAYTDELTCFDDAGESRTVID